MLHLNLHRLFLYLFSQYTGYVIPAPSPCQKYRLQSRVWMFVAVSNERDLLSRQEVSRISLWAYGLPGEQKHPNTPW